MKLVIDNTPGKNWRNGVEDVGPGETERSKMPATFTKLRIGNYVAFIATGPTLHLGIVPEDAA